MIVGLQNCHLYTGPSTRWVLKRISIAIRLSWSQMLATCWHHHSKDRSKSTDSHHCCYNIQLTNRMQFSVVCTLIDNDTCHHSGQNVPDSWGTAEWVHNKFWPLWWHISLSIRVQTTLNHIRFLFYHNINVKENVFFRARRRAWHIDTTSVVCTLINNGKLANQIAKLVAIVVKISFYQNCY